ncbi:chromatin-remodelling complex ATPase ISWI2 [Chondrus crispus]|uniref:Chromatin-remodelling complex ATPase ISWI2 n=1 Tax=Chondrus crispus TaxID=2769 RepID=R7QF22_CHOCR|nr:chromatin-remodelling complex ATPase ISWI2 [Chondrus crispus]CDF36036.1 chromatin-remodelling complex ATPase ISWI2 [Chondrus crispus]|eukprot:XP_005715854.1 chromatin-remodelling complex ATPase ISWI2 [Chondrus crispus]
MPVSNGDAPSRPSSKARVPATLAQSNAVIHTEIRRAQGDRRNFLLAQAPMFKHFIGEDDDSDTAAKPSAKQPEKRLGVKSKKRRMTEKEEDRLMMESAAKSDMSDPLVQTTRLKKQPSNVTGTMRPYQIEGLNFLIGLFERGLNGILADEMGLGKTLQTISLLGFLRQYKGLTGPHLIIVPKSTLGNWMNEIKRWCPDIRAVRFHGTQEERKHQMSNLIVYGKFDAVVTSYEVVTKEKAHLTKFCWRYLIIDEAHRIKNENSLLSQVVRMFTTQARLLITGTPLQNNLHELWALLNFLLPDVFSSSDVFEKWFSSVEAVEGDNTTNDTEKQQEIIGQLHAVLRPFLIRRLKSEVEHSLPPKKETVLFTKLSAMQLELYRNLLKKDIDAINGKGGDRVRLLNILMQLRKCANHPYLFDGVEDRSLDAFGDHLIQNCAKMTLLDKLLPRLKEGGHRVLIFSQMTRVLDILEDYCTMRQFKFCRIDGSTDGEWRDEQIADYNRDGSEKFIFLLSTRAGGLGINLATADTVVLYDSDWNAQCDLQAMDRAHRIGQRRPVNVYRLITENSVEERILRTAMSKLRLDTLVIQQGRLTQQKKNLQKDELLNMIRFGADKFFKSNASDYAEEDIEVILSRGAEKTKEMNEELGEKITTSGNLDMLDFKLSGDDANKDKSIFHFEGVNYKEKAAGGNEFFLDVGKRVRSKNYDEAAYYRDAMRQTPAPQVEKKKPRLKYRKEPSLPDHMLYNTPRLRELFQVEREIVDKFNAEADAVVKEGKEQPELPKLESLLSEEHENERETLLDEGYSEWTKREFSSFLRGIERYGRENFDKILDDIGDSKTMEQLVEYSAAFWEKGPTRIDTWPKVLKVIEDGEQKIARREEMERAIQVKVKRYDDPWKELDMVYSNNRSKTFIDEEDRWLICMTSQLGYGRWDDIKLEVRKAWQFRFNWWLKSRTPNELKRRVDVLIRLIEKENEEIAEQQKLMEKRKKNASRRRDSVSNGRLNGPSFPQKKRKTEQSQVDSFFSSKPKSQKISRPS